MAPPTRTQEWLKDRLAELQQILHGMGPDFSGFAATAEELHDRLDEGRFRLAVLGQFKRGKSSLLNALLGEALLPTGVLPLTAIPTILRYGPERQARVTGRNGQCETHIGPTEFLTQVLTRYVTERENPGNYLGVSHVEVEHPAGLLTKGVEIIDTPGIGSTILQNTRTAREVLPICDGALFVFSPDPPITEAEVHYLRAVKDAAARLIFVLTKADLLSPTERTEILTFLRQVLHEQAGFSTHERIFLVSARQAFEARRTGEGALWAQSGMGELETCLAEFLVTEKRVALQDAIRSKGARLIREALFTLDLKRKVIELPCQELERRSERFEAQLAKMNLERVYFHDRLAGDRRRLLQELDQQAEALAVQAREALDTCAHKARVGIGQGVGARGLERLIRTALSDEVDLVFGRAAKDLLAEATTRFQSIQDTHCREMETLIERVRRTAADLFEVPCLEGVALDRLETIREPRVVPHRWVTSFTEEAASWINRLLPPGLRMKRLERWLREDIDYLVARNVEELRWATRQNLEEAFRTFQGRMETQLEAVINVIRSSVRAALEHQTGRESQLMPELNRLEGFRQRLAQLLAVLSPRESPASHGSPL